MKKDYWIVKSFIYAFFIALFFNIISNVIINKFENIFVLTIITLIFVFLGIIFDAIGTSILVANESTFHAKSAKKIKSAKTAVYLIKNGSRISSIFCDILGDICGIISGGVAALISFIIAQKFNIPSLVAILIISSVISSLTVGGKAIGKVIATKKGDEVVFQVARIFDKFKKI